MRLGFSLRPTAALGRPTLALLLGAAVIGLIAARWADTAAWDDNLIWKDAA